LVRTFDKLPTPKQEIHINNAEHFLKSLSK
jgi:hypothetical protein